MTDHTPPDDLDLARCGDPAAFERLVRPHVPSIRRFARSFCGDPVEANDLAQESLLKAFRSIRGFRGQSSLTTWLYSVARSTFVDSRRGRAARARTLETALEPEHSPVQCGPDEILTARSDVERLRAALRQLEPKFRIPIVLCEIEGLSYEHVATIEQVPVGTVRSRISRARAKLLDLLNRSATDAVEVAKTGTAATVSPSTQRRTSQ